ncbi:transcription termination/antitermination protein NusA [Candidatus Falkowbacteria bacterium]|nr:MAG: transcription termination/antitermination protein NusA [Candidatus Falkowbacteria bacterium]
MSEITNAIKQICDEKGLSYEAVIATIDSALAAAYRKDYGEKNQNIKVEYNPETNGYKVYDIKTVVEDVPEEELLAAEEGNGEVSPKVDVKVTEHAAVSSDDGVEEEKHRFNPKTEIQISEAKAINKKYKLGDEIKTELETHEEYGRMAAQTAKQVIIQRLREAERDMVFGEFKDKEHEVITGFVQRREGRVVLIDLGKATGVVPPDEQIRGERYNSGERLKFYVKEVKITPRGPEIVLSRTSEEILKKVFFLEIPEISNGLVEIKGVAREAGSRSKVAVSAQNENIDPIGSCVGQRGSRIQTIIRELGGEKIDIIEHSEDVETFIANALAPAKVEDVKLVTDEHQAFITVKDDQLSLAIGKDGQNVRLAAHLTGWKIDIAGDGTGVSTEGKEEVVDEVTEEGEETGLNETTNEKEAMEEAGAETKVVAEDVVEAEPVVEGEEAIEEEKE